MRPNSTSAGSVRFPAVNRRAETGLDQRVHLARLRVPFQGRLREHEDVVQRDLEPAAAAGHQRDPRDHRRPGLEKLSRQTDGSGNVVSDDAELDLELMHLVRRVSRHGSSTSLALVSYG